MNRILTVEACDGPTNHVSAEGEPGHDAKCSKPPQFALPNLFQLFKP